MSENDEPEIAIGQAWRHKREAWREVYVHDFDAQHVYVVRNTSKRRQAISIEHLRRNYRQVVTR